MTEAWPRVNPNRRIALMDDLEEMAESDTLVNFDNFARSVLNDSEPGVRSRAITLLWENEGPDLVPIFIDLMQQRSLARSPRCRGIRIGKIYLPGRA